MTEQQDRPLSVLRIVNRVTETSAPYNQFSLPLVDKYDITLCTYYASPIRPVNEMECFAGNGTVVGFFRALRKALDHRDYDVVHLHSPLVAFWFLWVTMGRRKALPPTVVTVHNSFQNFKIRNRFLLLVVFACFGRVACCSRVAYESFPRLYRWLGGRRAGYVQNGVNVPRIDRVLADCRNRRDDDKFHIVCVSRLGRIKNLSTLLKAFQLIADSHIRLKLIGDGVLADVLKAERSRLGLDTHVEMTGLLPRNEVYVALRNADLFVSTSWGEGLPLATLEAMACGCPVLLSDIPPHREIAAGAETITLVPPDDAAGFAREIKRMVEMARPERRLIGRQGREHVRSRFSLASMHEGYARLYGDLQDERREPRRAA